MATSEMYLEQINDRIYATAQASVITDTDELPTEMRDDPRQKSLNPSFMWVTGRYVQGNKANLNGHYWTFDDLQAGERSILYTPLNELHRWDRPVGAFVETKLVLRDQADEGMIFPEIQALAAVWTANFPETAARVRAAHEANQLWFSMECVAEAKQCLVCDQIYSYRSQEVCDHLASTPTAPRRFINPTFLGGALIFPPEKPAWPEAEIMDVARLLTVEYANRFDEVKHWEFLMEMTTRGGE